VGDSRRSSAVVLQGFLLIAQLFVRLPNHALNEAVVLVCLQQFLERRFIVAAVERDPGKS
jgi:hypothetical protein